MDGISSPKEPSTGVMKIYVEPSAIYFEKDAYSLHIGNADKIYEGQPPLELDQNDVLSQAIFQSIGSVDIELGKN